MLFLKKQLAGDDDRKKLKDKYTHKTDFKWDTFLKIAFSSFNLRK